MIPNRNRVPTAFEFAGDTQQGLAVTSPKSAKKRAKTGSDSILVQRGYSSPVHFGFNNIRAMTPGATKLFEFGLRPTGPDLDTFLGLEEAFKPISEGFLGSPRSACTKIDTAGEFKTSRPGSSETGFAFCDRPGAMLRNSTLTCA